MGKVKPDASARATSTYFAYNNGVLPGNGTSYATPLLLVELLVYYKLFQTLQTEKYYKNSLGYCISMP